MDRNDLRSQSLDLLRFPLAIVVMTIHVWFPGVADATADVPALNALSGLVAGLLWDQSVPVYFFFAWGAGISINSRDIFVEFGRKARVAAVAYVALSAAYAVAYCHCAEAMPLLKKANQCAGLITAYNAAAWLLQRGVCRVNRFLASASFFIYVGHMLVVHEVYMALVRLTHADPTGGLGSAAAHVLSIPVTTGLLLGVFYLLRRYTPRLLKVVAGRK